MKPTASSNLAGRRLRDVVVLVGLLGVVLFSLAPAASQRPLVGSVALLGGVAWLGLGFLIFKDRPRRALGRVVIAAGITWHLQFVSFWEFGPAVFAAVIATASYWVSGAVMSFTLPAEVHKTWAERLFIATFTVYTTAALALALLTSDPAWLGYSQDAWWPGPVEGSDLRSAIGAAWMVGDGLAASVFVVLVVLRHRRMPGLDRSDTAPLFVAFCATAVYSAVRGLGGAWHATTVDAFVELSLIALLVPCALLWAERRRTLRDREMTGVLQQQLANRSTEFDDIQAALRLVLRDPTVRLLDLDAPEATTSSPSRRVVHSSSGEPLALIEGARHLERHQKTFDAVVASCGVAFENAHLRNRMRQQELISQSALAQANEATREVRRIERDLHDDMQQRLLALRMRLFALGKDANLEMRQNLDGISHELASTVRALRHIAHGKNPPDLTTLGLASVLRTTVSTLPLEVDLEVDSDIPEHIEVVAYYVISEALANVMKHANATSCGVTVRNESGEVVVRVEDNGVGKSHDGDGFGLTSIRRRVGELGGRLELLHRNPGTEVKAVIPCG